MSLSMTLYLLLSTGSTQENRKSSQHDLRIVDWEVKHKHKHFRVQQNIERQKMEKTFNREKRVVSEFELKTHTDIHVWST